jgi:hypothetical protein
MPLNGRRCQIRKLLEKSSNKEKHAERVDQGHSQYLHVMVEVHVLDLEGADVKIANNGEAVR